MLKKRVHAIVVVPLMLFASAFAGAAHAEEKVPRCVGWLTKAEIESALGVEVQAGDPVEYSPGFTLCSWTRDRPEGQLGLHLSFFELEAMREGPMTAESIPEYFDLQVSTKQGELGTEPATLEGIGKRAVLFSEEHLWIVMIELEEAFVHFSVSPTDITREQVETMARAAASQARTAG